MAKLKAPEGATGASYNGENFDVDKTGHITVPEEAVASLLDHGYTVAPDQPRAKKAAAAEPQAEPAAE